MAVKYSSLAEGFKDSELGAILKLAEQPEVISFAGGLPAPELFPIEEMKQVDVEILEKEGRKALQYGAAEGYEPLRQWIAERMDSRYQVKTSTEEILMVSGSQQGLDILGRVFCDKNDIVLMESPSYLGAINAFKLSGPTFMEVPTDEEGMIPEALDKILTEQSRVKMIYVIPDFQNPTGITWSLERRKAFMEVITRHEIPVIEDNPYGDLRYEGEFLPSLKSMDTKGLVIFSGTFSKIFAPGLRLGWLCADKDIINKCDIMRQSMDLQTASFAQRQAYYFVKNYDLEAHIKKIREVYKKRCHCMIAAMERYFPKEVSFTRPDGGLFAWVVLPEYINATEMLPVCLKQNVAYVPGACFYPNGGHANTFRLNYSNMNEERIEEGIRRLAEVIKAEMTK